MCSNGMNSKYIFLAIYRLLHLPMNNVNLHVNFYDIHQAEVKLVFLLKECEQTTTYMFTF